MGTSNLNQSEFLGMIRVGDGYRGTLQWIALCAMPDGSVLGVAPFGYWHTIYGKAA